MKFKRIFISIISLFLLCGVSITSANACNISFGGAGPLNKYVTRVHTTHHDSYFYRNGHNFTIGVPNNIIKVDNNRHVSNKTALYDLTGQHVRMHDGKIYHIHNHRKTSKKHHMHKFHKNHKRIRHQRDLKHHNKRHYSKHKRF